MIDQPFQVSRILKNIFWWLAIVWWVLTISVFYSYIIQTAEKKTTKWGTLVEAIFEPITFLPYTNMRWNNLFYKNLLFDGCLKSSWSWTKPIFEPNLCKVTTKDARVYTITVQDNKMRSDGHPVTIKDILFTYDVLVKQNKRNIPELQIYSKIEVSEAWEDKVRVTFPTTSVDNQAFFTLHILPQHILKDAGVNEYIALFSRAPVSTNCAKLQLENKDPNSLIFNLTSCPESNLNFYQLKSFPNFQDFIAYQSKNPGVVDFYTNQETLTGYISLPSVSNTYIAAFFNSKSERLSSDIKEAFSVYTLKTLYTGNYSGNLWPLHYIFPYQQLTWNLTKELSEYSPSSQDLDKRDIEKINMKKLPTEITIRNRNNKANYYVESSTQNYNLKINLDRDFEKITFSYNDWKEITPKTFDKVKKVTFLNIWPSQSNIDEWVNKYTIRWYRNGKPYTLMELMLYVIQTQQTGEDLASTAVDQADRIKIVYLKDETSFYVVNKLIESFKKDWINQYFTFIGYNDPDELQGKLSSLDYDIVLQNLALWLRQDISALFQSDDPTINPSLYKNPNLASSINDYFITTSMRNANTKQISSIMNKELPVLMLGKHITRVSIAQHDAFSGIVSEWALRQTLLNSIVLVENLDVDKQKVLNISNFIRFINQALH